MSGNFWDQFEIVGYDTPQYMEGFKSELLIIGVFIVCLIIAVILILKNKNIKDFFTRYMKKIVIGISIISLLVICYNLFFRYEYKVINEGRKVIKIDKLTGKTTYTHPEREQK